MNQKPLYIFDFDGTLSDPTHRRHLVEAPWIEAPRDGLDLPRKSQKVRIEGNRAYVRDPKFVANYDLFNKACSVDAPKWGVIGLMLQLYQIGSDIQIWSARPEALRDVSVEWLHIHAKLQPHAANAMLKNMRPDGDSTPDEQLKRKWLHAMPKADRARLAGVFDDRPKVVKMWRDEGLTCFAVEGREDF